jgi:hypothetical protein
MAAASASVTWTSARPALVDLIEETVVDQQFHVVVEPSLRCLESFGKLGHRDWMR